MLYFDDCLKLIKEFEQRQLIKKKQKNLINKSITKRREKSIFKSIDVFITHNINSQIVVVDVEKQTISTIIITITISTIDNESIKREREKFKKIIKN